MSISYRKMEKVDIEKVIPLYIEYWNGTGMVQLEAVNDELHEHFYGKLGYGDATNMKLKSKFL